MKITIRTLPHFFVEEDKIITSLFEEKLDCLFLYKPHSSPVYLERLLTLIPKQYYKNIVTYNHFYIQEEFRLSGIVLNEECPNEPIPYKGVKGCCCSTVEELIEKKKKLDFLIFGPFPQNIQSSKSPIMEEYKAAKSKGLIDKKVFAYGDIDLNNAKFFDDCGFGGIELSDLFWKNFDDKFDIHYKSIIDNFKKIKESID